LIGGLGFPPSGLKGDPVLPSGVGIERISRRARYSGDGAEVSAATRCADYIGLAAAPMFFWGGWTARPTGSRIALGLILMDVWRD